MVGTELSEIYTRQLYSVHAQAAGSSYFDMGVSGLAPKEHLNHNNLQPYLYHPELYECLIPGENGIFIQPTH
jgi:hypothetical protein